MMTAEMISRISSLHELTFGAISEFVGKSIEKLLGLGWFMAVALINKDRLIGTMVIAGNPGQEAPDREKILTFAGITAHAFECRQAEEALRESEERFRRVSAMTSDVAYSCSAKEDGRFSIEWMMGAADRIVGYSCEEIKARGGWSFLVVEEDLGLFEKNVIGLAPGSKGSCELRVRHKNGGIGWIASFAECISNTQTPGCLLLFGGMTDITERKRTEEEIRAKAKELQEKN
jgi:PAS domain S-box-containing protein